MDLLPLDILHLILLPFQENEESYFVGLVCKQWHNLIVKNIAKLGRKSVTSYYAKNGTVSSLKLIRATINNDEAFFDFHFIAYARKDIIEWATSELALLSFKPAQVCEYLAKLAALNGYLSIVKWATDYGCVMSDVDRYAAEGGHLEVLSWLKENGFSWDVMTCASAARTGKLGTLKWLRENECPWDTNTVNHAAGGGHLEVLKWAIENGCSWFTLTCSCAAANGHLETLKWLRNNGCPWDSDTCYYAERGGHWTVLQWARENNCPEEEEDQTFVCMPADMY